MDLDRARAKRWWKSGRKIGSRDRAARFVDDVGFALLFPKSGVQLPSLWEAASDRPFSETVEWGSDIERVWRWKDELPREGLAWYGEFVRGRKSFLSPTLLADLYPRSGGPADFDEQPLSPEARRIARMLLRSGPQSTAALREAFDIDGVRGRERLSRAIGELGRALVLTHFGTEEEGTGWASAVLELTTRVFPIPRRRDREAARLRAARRFLDTMIEARPFELGNAFLWGAEASRKALDELVARGQATREANAYRATGTGSGAGRSAR